jgi:hypothetical protein
MSQTTTRGRLLSIFLLLCVQLIGPNSTRAARAQTLNFHVLWSGKMRLAPSVNAGWARIAEQSDVYAVLMRSENNDWLQVKTPSGPLWVPLAMGSVNGDLTPVPAIKPNYGAIPPNPSRAALPNWLSIPSLPRAKALLQAAAKAGRDMRFFTVAGDSNALWFSYHGRIGTGNFEYGRNGYLRNTVVARFDPSFAHEGVAVGGGLRAADMFDASRNKPPICRGDEGVLACELRTSKASIVLVQLGTGDKFVWKDFEDNYRAILNYALANNVLPILFTKADDLDSQHGGASQDTLNNVIRKLAAEYQLPMADLYAATRSLPTIPNPELPTRPFTKTGLKDEWGHYFHLTDEARILKLFGTLHMLDVLTR